MKRRDSGNFRTKEQKNKLRKEMNRHYSGDFRTKEQKNKLRNE